MCHAGEHLLLSFVLSLLFGRSHESFVSEETDLRLCISACIASIGIGLFVTSRTAVVVTLSPIYWVWGEKGQWLFPWE
jgi:hypothetical protein